MIFDPGWAMLLFVVQVIFLGRALCTKETMFDFCKIMGSGKGDIIVWYWVTRHLQVFCLLMIGQRTPGFWGHIKWWKLKVILVPVILSFYDAPKPGCPLTTRQLAEYS